MRSSLVKKKGTMILNEAKGMETPVVSGVAFDKNEAKLSLNELPDQPGVAAAIFGALAKDSINVDMIIQSSAENGTNSISFTVSRNDLKRAIVILESVKNKLGAKELVADSDVAKVAIVGVGMRSHAGVAAKMFAVLADAGINLEMISTSEIKVACIVKESDGQKAVKILHKTFGLGSINS